MKKKTYGVVFTVAVVVLLISLFNYVTNNERVYNDNASSISINGGSDGPTSIFRAGKTVED